MIDLHTHILPHMDDGAKNSATALEMLDMEIVPDPLDTITTHETYQKVEETMNKVLSDFELKVLNEYVNGASYVEIANKLDSHVKAVDNAVQRIKKKVDKHLADEKF